LETRRESHSYRLEQYCHRQRKLSPHEWHSAVFHHPQQTRNKGIRLIVACLNMLDEEISFDKGLRIRPIRKAEQFLGKHYGCLL
jgi:hypothetical protein